MSDQTYLRFTVAQRIEHGLLIVSFTTLAVTGLPQKFIGADWAQSLIRLMGGIETTRQIHHIAAIVLMMETVFHVVRVGYRLFVQRVSMTMLPAMRDANDALNALLFNLGFRKAEPQAGRYSFGEKAEYWAVVWGTVIMIITGFMMWNPIATTNLFPGQFIPAAKTAHGGEAVLAVLAIIIWHMYNVHLRHFNKSMFTGRLTEHEMIEEHPLELADLKAGVAQRPGASPQLRKRQQQYYPVAGILTAALLFGLYQFMTFEKTAIDTVERGANITPFAPLTPTPLPTPRPTPTAIALLSVWEGNLAVVLQQKCGECHDGSTAGLDLTTYSGALKGSKKGPVIVPGDPEGSRIVTKMQKNHPGELSEFELSVLMEWIKAGAPEK
jgi:cytochrome b subunit of formate dehydrogenase